MTVGFEVLGSRLLVFKRFLVSKLEKGLGPMGFLGFGSCVRLFIIDFKAAFEGFQTLTSDYGATAPRFTSLGQAPTYAFGIATVRSSRISRSGSLNFNLKPPA